MTRFLKTILATGLCVGTVGLVGCHKAQQSHVDASRPLQQSFQTSEPQVQQAIGAAATGLKTGNYTAAARALEPVLARRTLTPEQRQAVGLALQQISQAVAANPSLDSKELYELRVKMFHAARGQGF